MASKSSTFGSEDSRLKGLPSACQTVAVWVGIVTQANEKATCSELPVAVEADRIRDSPDSATDLKVQSTQ